MSELSTPREIRRKMAEGHVAAIAYFCECSSSLPDGEVRPVRWFMVMRAPTGKMIFVPLCDSCYNYERSVSPDATFVKAEESIFERSSKGKFGRTPVGRAWEDMVSIRPSEFVRMNAQSEPYRLIRTGAPESIVEFAARLCYNSLHRMGTSRNFLGDLWSRGHLDVFEHVAGIFPVSGEEVEAFTSGSVAEAIEMFRFARVVPRDKDTFVVLANARVVREWGERYAAWRNSYQYIMSQHNTFHLGFSDPMGRVDMISYIDHPLGIGHACFLVRNVSRAMTHQLVRHRLMSYSQQSQRYVNMANNPVVIPPSIEGDALRPFMVGMQESRRSYVELRGLGVKKQDARFVLPEAMSTQIVVSGPFDAWRHVFWLRALDKAAQWEIRGVCIVMLVMLASATSVFRGEVEYLEENFDELTSDALTPDTKEVLWKQLQNGWWKASSRCGEGT